MVSKNAIIKQLQDLYLYSLYGFSKELKPLASILNPDEKINFVARGLYQGSRQMMVVTSKRVIIIDGRFGNVKVIKLNAIINYSVTKVLFASAVRFNTEYEVFEMTNVPRKVLDLFIWAMEQKDVK